MVAPMPSGIREVGAGKTTHQGGQQDVDLRQAAIHPAGQHFTEVHDALGNACIVHHNARADKERDGQQRNTLRAGNRLLREHNGVYIRIHNEVNHCAAEHRNVNRHFEEQQHQHDNRRKCKYTIHASSASFASDLTPFLSAQK